jgi:hypothetical protein
LNTIDEQDIDLTERWYQYAAQQAGFVGQALARVRRHTGQTVEEQRLELCADPASFIHLQGMPQPRAQTLIVDANQIAEECGIADSLAFVRAMILAYKIENINSTALEDTYYQAAFDERDDLDSYPDED